MKSLTLDVETTTINKGDPFNPNNSLCYVGIDDSSYHSFDIEYSDSPFGGALNEIQTRIRKADILVGFNIKFDLHWLRRYGIDFSDKLIWDCAVVHFILNNQKTRFPSLNEVSAYHELGQKEDKVAEYWAKGIDTKEIPKEELESYLAQDVSLTTEIFLRQYQMVLDRGILPLVTLHNQDLLMLEEMEWNGMYYDCAASQEESSSTQAQIDAIDTHLGGYFTTCLANWSSPDFVSAALFGGIVKWKDKETYTFVYKNGGEALKTRNVVREVTLPRLVEPIKGTDRSKDGYFSTSEDVLKRLKAKGIAKDIIKNLLERRNLEKLNGTYLDGLPKRIRESQWEGNLLHGNLNQVRVITGRLASDKPNMQNLDKRIKKHFRSRYYGSSK